MEARAALATAWRKKGSALCAPRRGNIAEISQGLDSYLALSIVSLGLITSRNMHRCAGSMAVIGEFDEEAVSSYATIELSRLRSGTDACRRDDSISKNERETFEEERSRETASPERPVLHMNENVGSGESSKWSLREIRYFDSHATDEQ